MVDSWGSKVHKNSESSSVRRRIPKACNYCRQRKIKCDGDTPCVNCTSHKIDCVYSKTVRKRKRTQTKKLSLQDLDKRVNKLDQKFDALNSQVAKILALLKNKKDTTTTKKIFTKSNEIDRYEREEEDDEDEDEEEEEDLEEEDLEEEEFDEEEIEEGEEVTGEDYDDNDDDYKFNGKWNNDYNKNNFMVKGNDITSNVTNDIYRNNLNLSVKNEKKYPISPDESVNSGLDDNGTIKSPPIANVTNQILQDNFSFSNNQLVQEFDLTLGALENAEQKLNYIYGEIPTIQTHLENELY